MGNAEYMGLLTRLEHITNMLLVSAVRILEHRPTELMLNYFSHFKITEFQQLLKVNRFSFHLVKMLSLPVLTHWLLKLFPPMSTLLVQTSSSLVLLAVTWSLK